MIRKRAAVPFHARFEENSDNGQSFKRVCGRICVLILLAGLIAFYQVYNREVAVVYKQEVKKSIEAVNPQFKKPKRKPILETIDDNVSTLSTDEFSLYFMQLAKSKSASSKALACHSVTTSFNFNHVCCSQNNRENGSCLPGVIVMGVQKGGTTALHSYLMLHPNLSASKRKELHIYDMDRSWLAKQQFKIATSFQPRKPIFQKQKLNFETTPSYSASPDACVRMGVYLPGTTKFILIVRNPIDRAWSELQMKARRVDQQTDFKRMIYECSDDIKHCFQPGLATAVGKVGDMSSIRRCISKTRPFCSKIISHSKFPNLFKGLSMPTVSKQGIGSRFVANCFSQKYKNFELFDRACFGDQGMFREKNIVLPGGLEREVKAMNEMCLKDMELVEALNKDEFMLQTKFFSRNQIRCWFKHFQKRCTHCRDASNPFECSEQCVEENKADFVESNCPRKDYKASSEPFCRGVYCACFPDVRMPSDISRGYIFRGLYNIQFRNCFNYLDRNRVLIIYNSELRKYNKETMDKIIDFTNIPYFDYSTVTYDDARKAFDGFYPKFEEQTGWSANGTSSLGKHIRDDVRDLLLDAYKDDVSRLRDFIGPSEAFDEEFKDFTEWF